MPSHTRRGAFGTTVWVCVGFRDPRYTDCFVLAGAVRRLLLLLLLSVFIGAVGLSVEDSIKLGEVSLAVGAVGTMSCGSTGCLSCRGKQSTSLLLSSLGRSLLLLLLLSYDLFFRFSVAGVSVGDSIRLLQLETAVGRDSMAVGVEYHGGLGGIGIENTMVDGVRRLEAT